MTDVAEVMAKPIAQRLLLEEPVLRLSYTGLDGGPRVIPLGYLWDGSRFLFWTIPHSAKVRALRADPRVAITIDILGPPPRVLLARGRAELSTVDGVPDGYLEASHRGLAREAWDDFDAQVRAPVRADGHHHRHAGLGEAARLRDHRAGRGGATDPGARPGE